METLKKVKERRLMELLKKQLSKPVVVVNNETDRFEPINTEDFEKAFKEVILKNHRINQCMKTINLQKRIRD